MGHSAFFCTHNESEARSNRDKWTRHGGSHLLDELRAAESPNARLEGKVDVRGKLLQSADFITNWQASQTYR